MDRPEGRLTTSGGEMAFVDLGDPEEPAVVLLHGFPTSSYLWRHLIPLLEPWMRVIAPDLLGSGDSAKPADAPLDVQAQASQVRELLVMLAVDSFAVIGHGHGGGIAQLLAADPGARAMVLIDSIAFQEVVAAPLRRAIEELEGGRDIRGVIRAFIERGMGEPRRLTEDDLVAYVRPFDTPEGRGALARLADEAARSTLTGAGHALEGLDVPVLMLWGEEDPFVTVEMAERLADILPLASLGVIPGASHFLTEDAPETIGPLVFEYLRARYLGRPHVHEEPGPVVVPLGRRPPDGDAW